MVTATHSGMATGRVLHVLDHSWPVMSGYSIRSRNLVSAQHKLGQAILVVTGPLHQLDDPNASEVDVDGVLYKRTRISGFLADRALRGHWLVLREWETVRLLRNRILELIDSQRGVHRLCALSSVVRASRFASGGAQRLAFRL